MRDNKSSSDIFPPGEPPAAAQPATERLIERLDQAHMFACDVASSSIEAEKLGVIGAVIREARAAIRRLHPPASVVPPAIRVLNGLPQIDCLRCEGTGIPFDSKQATCGCLTTLTAEERALDMQPPASAVSPTPETVEDFCSTCGDLRSRHFTPCNLAADVDGVLRLLVRLVNEGKTPAALRVLARHMQPHEDDGMRIVQSAVSKEPQIRKPRTLNEARTLIEQLLQEFPLLAPEHVGGDS